MTVLDAVRSWVAPARGPAAIYECRACGTTVSRADVVGASGDVEAPCPACGRDAIVCVDLD